LRCSNSSLGVLPTIVLFIFSYPFVPSLASLLSVPFDHFCILDVDPPSRISFL
jgi:hypothetical protein